MEDNNVMDMGDVFNLSPDALIQPPKKKSIEIYQPAADKGKDQVYQSVIRFIPNIRNPRASKIQKYYVWLDDGTDTAYSVDCPSTVGKKSILNDTYWKLKNSQSAKDQELAEKFSRTESYYSIVQIVRDENEPELEGKLMVFKFGTKINTKIENLLKPTDGFTAAVNPYDLFDGKLFKLKITKKQQWNNYDQCEFIGDRCPLVINGKHVTNDDREMVKAWLTENSPELEKYEYKEWDEEMTNKVMTAIRNIVPDRNMIDNLVNSVSSEKGGFVASAPAKKAQPVETEFGATQETPAAKNNAGAAASNLDDLYNGL